MKTKLLFILGCIFWYVQMFSQSNRIVDRIIHFDQFVKHLQSRQVNTATIRLDSITRKNYDAVNSVYNLSSMDIFLFDSNNLNTEYSFNIWDVNNSVLFQQGKTEYVFNASGMISSKTDYYFDSSLNVMVPSQKHLYTYNASGQVIEMLSQQYDTASSQFVNQDKEIYTYAQTTDPKPNLVNIYQWDTANATWIDDKRGTITYNSNFQFTDIIIEAKDISNNTWVNSFHYIRNYDANFRLLEHLMQQWQSNAWVNVRKKSVSYTSMANYDEIVIENFNWDSVNSSWAINDKHIEHVDSNNNILQEEYYYWDSLNSQLFGSNKLVYNYNTNDIEVDYYMWDSQTQNWSSDILSKYVFNYDMSVPKSDLILPYYLTPSGLPTDTLFETGIPAFDGLNHKLLSKEFFSRATASDPWSPVFKKIYNYTDTSVSIEDHRQITAKVYPNPFSDHIRFEVASDTYSLNLFDLNGRLLFAADLNANESVNLSFLNKGIYIYKVQTNQGVASGKIIKK